MPHVILEISPELQSENWQDFFAKAHAILSPYANINDCKSRINLVNSIYLGEGTQTETLIFLQVALKSRPPEVIQTLGEQLFAHLTAYIEPILQKRGLRARHTLEMRVLEHYWP